jgi:hypothetical protein
VHRVKLFAAIAAVAALSGTTRAYAETIPVRTPILLPGDDLLGPAASRQEAPRIALGGKQYLVVWTDHRTNFVSLPPFSEEQTARDVYAARVDANHDLIDASPIIVSQDLGYQFDPQVAWNGENWLVVWENQSPTGSFYESRVYAARVSPGGTVLDTPFSVFGETGASGTDHAVTSDGTNWLVVEQGHDAPAQGILGVRVSPTGVVLDAAPVVLVPPTYYLYFDISVHSAGGEHLLTYKASGNFEARRFQLDLTPIGSVFGVPGLVLTSRPIEYFIAWTSGSNLVGSPMAPDGTLSIPAGVAITPASGISGTDLGWDGTTWWASWRHAIDGIEATRITTDGVVLDFGGVALDPPNESFMGDPSIEGGPGAGMQVVWQDRRSGGIYPEDVFAAPYDAAGQPGASVPISLGAPAQRLTDITAGEGGFVVVFDSEISGSRRIKAQRIDATGTPIDPAPVEVASGPYLSGPSVSWSGSVVLVAWSDGDSVVARRLANDLTPIDPAPFVVMDGGSPDVAALGNVFLVVGTQPTISSHFVHPFSMRVDGASGALLDPQPVALGQYFARNPRVVALGSRWLATWQRNVSHDDNIAYVKANFIETDGTAGSEFYVSGSPVVGFTPDVAFSGSTALFAWTTGTIASANNDLQASIMLPDGTFPGPSGGTLLSDAADRQRQPAVGWSGSEFVVVWVDKRNSEFFFDERTDIYGARVDETGSVSDPNGFAVASRLRPETEPAIAGGNGQVFVAASLFEAEAPFCSYRLGVIGVGSGVTSAPACTASSPDLRVVGVAPNPFGERTELRYSVPRRANVEFIIHDVAGRRVRTVQDGIVSGGEHAFVWDGCGDDGRRLPNGVYLLRLSSDYSVETSKVVLVR